MLSFYFQAFLFFFKILLSVELKDRTTEMSNYHHIFENVPRRIRSNITRNPRPVKKFIIHPAATVPISIKEEDSDDFLNYCTVCKVYFHYNSHYEAHCKKVHENLKPAKYHHCGERYGNKSNMNRHTRWKCTVDKQRGNATKIRLNTKKMLPVQCELCKITLYGIQAYERHALQNHPGDKMIVCGECEEKFYRRNSLTKHVRRHHMSHDLWCGICNIFFNGSDTKDAHLKKCWENQNNKIIIRDVTGKEINMAEYTCKFCNSAFVYLKEYEEHGLFVHPELRVFECEYEGCGAGFRRKASMLRHVKDVHGEGDLRCAFCDKFYARRDHLNLHESNCSRSELLSLSTTGGRRAHDKRLMTCDVCNKTYYMQAKSFKNHVRSHKFFVKCDRCNERFHRFKNPTGLADHVKRRHPPIYANIQALLDTVAQYHAIKEEDNRRWTELVKGKGEFGSN